MAITHKVHVTVPAVSTNIGPGYDVLGLALSLRNVIQMSLSNDDRLSIQVRGEGADMLPHDFYHPVMMAAIRLFQECEQAPVGLDVVCTNTIPLDVGLSATVTMIVGGLVSANTLLGTPFRRDDLIALAAELSGQPEAVVTAMRGGLGICSSGPDGLIYRAVQVSPLRIVLVVPDLPDYDPLLRGDLPAKVPMADAVHNIGHTALLVEALQTGDFKLLRQTLDDRLHEPYRCGHIPGYDAVVEAAKEAGAGAVTLSGAGPALLAFTKFNHERVEDAIVDTFQMIGVSARTWTLSVDMQGVVISVVQ